MFMMAAQTVHRQISVLSTSKHPYKQTLASPVTGTRPLEKCRNGSILKRDWSPDLFLISVKAKLTIGWISTGKLCLCSAPRIWLGIILLFFSSFFLKSPLNSTHVIFAQNIPKYSSSDQSRLSLGKVLITSHDIFSKICKQRAGASSEKL